MKNIFKITITLFLLYLIYYKRTIIVTSVLSSINLFNNSIFPSIFPIMILSDYILSTNIINILTNTLGLIFSKLFNLSKISIYPFIMSTISGTPSNSKYIKDLLNNNYITKEEAIKLLSICINYNPLLIISLTNYLKLKDSITIIILNILCNILVGLINRNYKIIKKNNNYKIQNFNIINSINNTINTLINILGIITLFNIITNILPIKHPLITGILELTNGLNLINNINITYKRKIIYTSILLSFSGLSIITQIKSILNDTLNYSIFYKSRIIHLITILILVNIIY